MNLTAILLCLQCPLLRRRRPMLRTPNVITEELMITAYIKLQVNIIVMTLEKMLALPASTSNGVAPINIENFCLDAIIDEASMSIAHLRQHVVQQATTVRNLLDSERKRTAVVMHEGACALDKLSLGLEALGMGDESIQISNCAATLARTLVDASGGRLPDPAAILAFYLLRQSTQYYINGDKIRSLQAV